MSQGPSNGHDEKTMNRVPTERIRTLKKLVIQRKRSRLIIPLTLLGILAGITLAQQTAQQQVVSSGTIKVIGVSLFWDRACTNRVTSITWGLVTPGTSVTRYVYVRNDGTATGTLSMSCGNWTPTAAASCFRFTWNCSNFALSRNAVTCAKFTLAAQSNTTGVTDFSFTILVQAAG